MSFDLAVWYPHRRLADDEAARLYDQVCERRAAGMQAHPAIDAFYADLTAMHPGINDVPDDRIDDSDYSPWSFAFGRSPAHLTLSCVWPKADYVARLVLDLAHKYGLTVYDPQLGMALDPDWIEFHLPPPTHDQQAAKAMPAVPPMLTLTAGGQPPLTPGSFSVVKRELGLMRRGRHFVILERADGSYIQTAGDARRLTIEVRNYQGFSFAHSVLGHPPLSEQVEEISHPAGKTKVRANEVLKLPDAIEAFRAFYRDGAVSPDFILRDMTAIFH